MTPEERAKALASEVIKDGVMDWTDWQEDLADIIATAIREAVAEKQDEIHLLRINLAEARQQIAQAKAALKDKTA